MAPAANLDWITAIHAKVFTPLEMHHHDWPPLDMQSISGQQSSAFSVTVVGYGSSPPHVAFLSSRL